MDDESNIAQAWLLTAEENYAHARDHEHLRGQITAILVAAAFILIGLAVDKGSDRSTLIYVGISAVSIGALNVYLVLIHNNRFAMHVDIARNAKSKIAQLEEYIPKIRKRFSLGGAWCLVACLPIFAGVGLTLLALNRA